MATALATLMSLPAVALAPHPTPVDELTRLRAALGPGVPRLLMKRDDLLSFGAGRQQGAKDADGRGRGASRPAPTRSSPAAACSRITRASPPPPARRSGLHVVLVLNGAAAARRPPATRGSIALFGAEMRYVPIARRARADDGRGRRPSFARPAGRPFIVPLGASTPTGALGFARGVAELAAAGLRPDVIVHATSSGGTQAGLIAGCALFGLARAIIGVSADDPAAGARARSSPRLLDGMAARLGAKPSTRRRAIARSRSTTRFVGDGYGVPTPASTEALELVARTRGHRARSRLHGEGDGRTHRRRGFARGRAFAQDQTVLFWHTGGRWLG